MDSCHLQLSAHGIFSILCLRSIASPEQSGYPHRVPQSRNSFLDGLALYNARLDKGYSLVDCISMQTMRREGLTDILTNDRHF